MNRFDPGQTRDAGGRWAAVGGAVLERLRAAGSHAAHLEHAAKSFVEDSLTAGVNRLPSNYQHAVRATLHVARVGTRVAFSSWTAGQAMVERVARERGLDPEAARRLRGVMSSLDLATFKPLSLALGAAGVSHATLGLTSLIPPASAAYLAYSTARDPLATWRAARGVARSGLDFVAARARRVFNERRDPVDDLGEFLRDSPGDWPFAVLMAVVRQGADARTAVAVAGEVLHMYPTDPGSSPGDGTDPTANALQDWLPSAEKLRSFGSWLKDSARDLWSGVGEDLAGISQLAFRRGAGRSFDEARAGHFIDPSFRPAAKEQFVDGVLRDQGNRDRLDLLRKKVGDEAANHRDSVVEKVDRAVNDGVAAGKSRAEVWKDVATTIDREESSAVTTVGDEVVRGHAEGQVAGFEEAGVTELFPLMEWTVHPELSKSGVCPRCRAMKGTVWTITDARGKIPLHRRCKCSWRAVRGSKEPAAVPAPLLKVGRSRARRDLLKKIYGRKANAAAGGPNCGVGPGGFLPGNTCAAGGGGGAHRSAGHDLSSGDGVVTYLRSTSPGVFSQLAFDKIKYLNPSGVTGGTFITPLASTKTGNPTDARQLTELMAVLPPGTVIKRVNVSAAQMAAGPYTGSGGRAISTAGGQPPAHVPTPHGQPPVAVPPAFPRASVGLTPDQLPSAKKFFGSGDRAATVLSVHGAMATLGISPRDNPVSYEVAAVLNHIRSDTDGSVGHMDVDRAMKNVYALTNPGPVRPLFDHFGTGRGPNRLLPDETRPHLSPDQLVAAQRYTTAGYDDLNTSLRKTGLPPTRHPLVDYEKMHTDLQGAFAAAKVLPTPIKVVRGMKLDAAGVSQLEADLKSARGTGRAYVPGGYVSTNVGGVAQGFSGNVTLHIDAIHGLDVKPFSHHPHANEFLLDHGSGFRVDRVARTAAGLTVHLTQLPPGVAVAPRVPRVHRARGSVIAGTLPPGVTAVDPSAIPRVKPGKFDQKVPVHERLMGTQAWRTLLAQPDQARPALHTGHAGGSEDKFMTALMAEVGRDHPPPVLGRDAMDDLAKTQGYTLAYRGLRASGGKSALELHQQARYGGHYSGAGMYGNGVYMAAYTTTQSAGPPPAKGLRTTHESSARGTADSYSDSTPGSVVRYAIPPTARVVSHRSSKRLASKARNELSSAFSAGKITSEEYRLAQRVLADEGRVAVLHNYDFIAADRSSGYMVLLNRTVTPMEKENP
jgi:hypothetical protein